MTDESNVGGGVGGHGGSRGGHGGRGSRDGQGGGIGAEAGFAEALGGLSVGAEPPMPDLVPGAIRKGVRIRRRRRIAVAAGSAAMVATLMGGGVAVTQAFLADGRAAPPAATVPAVRYPSLKLLRSIVPAETGTVQSSNPAAPRVQGRYFRLTSDKGAADLYVAIRRTVTQTPVLSPTEGATCANSGRRTVVSVWMLFSTFCETVPAASGGHLMSYQVMGSDGSSSAPTGTPRPSDALGVSYLTPEGWTVEVIAGDLNKDGLSVPEAVPSKAELSAIATDSRLFGAVTASGS
ncbi:hypothetical protein ACFT7S_07825 [Streptomyces sp. NPDC057136]|uniref:hypothetical protein n=1 Tax=Streptomyces sp. NPDC057136 TaxID=3346029 RepID=UPI003625932B